MNRFGVSLGFLLLTACTTLQAQVIEEMKTQVDTTVFEVNELTTPTKEHSLPDMGEAPELYNEVWLNTEQPLRLSELRGKVVLLDMWTFG